MTGRSGVELASVLVHRRQDDEAISPDTERHFARRMGSGANTVEIASSHAAMVSYPAEVAELIAKAAT